MMATRFHPQKRRNLLAGFLQPEQLHEGEDKGLAPDLPAQKAAAVHGDDWGGTQGLPSSSHTDSLQHA